MYIMDTYSEEGAVGWYITKGTLCFYPFPKEKGWARRVGEGGDWEGGWVWKGAENWGWEVVRIWFITKLSYTITQINIGRFADMAPNPFTCMYIYVKNGLSRDKRDGTLPIRVGPCSSGHGVGPSQQNGTLILCK